MEERRPRGRTTSKHSLHSGASSAVIPESPAGMGANAATVRCAQPAGAAASPAPISKSTLLLALVVPALAVAALATNHGRTPQQYQYQHGQSVLAKWRCFLYSRWLDCSLLFEDYPAPNPNTITTPDYLKLFNYIYKPSAHLRNKELVCSYPEICPVTPSFRRRDGGNYMISTLRSLDDVTSDTAPRSTTAILPQDNEASLQSDEDTTKSERVDVDVVQSMTDELPKSSNRRYQSVVAKRNQVLPIKSTSTSSSLTYTDETEQSVETTPTNLKIGSSNPSVANHSHKASENPEPRDDRPMPTVNRVVMIENDRETKGKTDSSTGSKTSTEKKSNVYKVVVLPAPLSSLPKTENGHSNASLASEIATPNDSEVFPHALIHESKTTFKLFKESLDRLERKFLLTTFTKLTALSPADRKVNGISFLQSGLLLHLLLVSLSTEVEQTAAREIEECIGLHATDEEKIEMLQWVVSRLPQSSGDLKFRWSSRLAIGQSLNISSLFHGRTAGAINLTLSQLNTTEPAAMTKILNDMVDADSGGTMGATFEEQELARGACGAALGTLSARARWRAAPTLLNGTRAFRDAGAARAARFFRVNDRVRHARLIDWRAEAIEIPYATPGLSLLVVVPEDPSLGELVARVAQYGLDPLLDDLRPLRAAVTLPLYTLRMTLLLPNKLHDMGMPSLVDVNNTDCTLLKLSHAVQRLMFWAEAGRNAYKDDGIEWDPRPDVEVLVDRPYLFFVRWNDVTLMNGNFVL